MSQLKNAELIVRPDGSIYHLSLRPEQVATTVLLVGDPQRVTTISNHFDRIESRTQHREFVAHTGELNGKRLTALSTGIGTDNIDIVLNELDALFNIDFRTRTPQETPTRLQIFRIGTSGGLQPDLPIESVVLSEFGLGLDGLLHFYPYSNSEMEENLLNLFTQTWDSSLIQPYCTTASDELLAKFPNFPKGITATCLGFYAPQGRNLRIAAKMPNFLEQLRSFHFQNSKIYNFEMETAAIYGLAKLLGHQALSINVLLANRTTGEFSQNPQQAIEKTIQMALQIITN